MTTKLYIQVYVVLNSFINTLNIWFYVGGLRFYEHALHMQVGGAVERWWRIENDGIDKSKLTRNDLYIIARTVHLSIPVSFNLALSNSLYPL